MPAVEQVERRTYTDAEKLAFVKRLQRKPKEQTVKDLCEELGVGQPILYTWKNRVEKGLPLTMKRGTPGKPPGTAIAVRSKADARQLEIAGTRPAPVHVEVRSAAPLTMSERDELVLLRAEVKRYRRMVFASMEGP